MKALSFGDWAGHLYGEWTRAQNTTTPSPLGGFLRLTGLPRNSLYGDTTLFGRLLVARRIGALPSTIGGAVRLGFSMELGGSYGGNEPYSVGRMKQAVSASLSVDTRFGPVYLGAGATRGAGSGVYLFLGPIW
jgi:NTE family protein